MPDCHSESKTVKQCLQTRDESYSQCTETRDESYALCTQHEDQGYNQCSQYQDQGYHTCSQYQDQGYNTCSQWADQGYHTCSDWAKNCCTWKPCVWACNAFTWICQAWVWVTNMVCVGWTWVTSMVCVAWFWVTNLVCVAYVWVANIVCVAWTWIVSIVCVTWVTIKSIVCVVWAAIVFVFINICCADPLWKELFKCWKVTRDMPRNPVDKKGWILTFEDDFDSGSIDYTKWIDHLSFVARYSIGLKEVGVADFVNGNFPDRYWSPDYTFGPSTVKLIAHNTPFEVTIPANPSGPNTWDLEFSVPYTVQALQWNTNPLLEQRHGYFEIRCKSQNTRDMWPAFWLFGVTPDISVGPPKTWPPELDIFEFMSRKPNIFTTTQHWGHDDATHGSEGKRHRSCRAGERFHIYAAEWNEEEISWYLDNKLLRSTKTGVSDFIYPMSVIINSNIDDRDCREPQRSSYPNYFEVDYVRVYERA